MYFNSHKLFRDQITPEVLLQRLLHPLVAVSLVLGLSILYGTQLQNYAPFLLGLALLYLPLRWSFKQPAQLARKAVIVGANSMGYHLAEQLKSSRELKIEFQGFFDDPAKSSDRLPRGWMGCLERLPEYVKHYGIDVVYIALPSSEEGTIAKLLDELQDTTACVYVVPNWPVINPIQTRIYSINGVPVVALWEIPFTRLQSWLKRTIDVILSSLALLGLMPLMLLIALGIKLTSPGPILFKQRRYGLNGKEIIIYKFRSMRVMEDGSTVVQARRHDSRVTPLGAFLRRTSLDELPQFINVLQGRMSIVGPRPHAIAHNEEYRKLIKGYMLRHKVKPGITGWAQVNGFRGETDTLEKMQKRVDYDLYYLKNWSLLLDLQIILRTALVFFKSQNAY
uniref:Undecaprenyl-phosphate glucose phosphotransferase n=1 Tax=Cyanothece sp. (strain PCC 7425 / ATCC 29141) TaxID=395961 RepID=B8HLM1_CYAP4